MKFISLIIFASIIFTSCVKNKNSNSMCQDGYCYEISPNIDSLRYDMVHYGDTTFKGYSDVLDKQYIKVRKVSISNVDNDSMEIIHWHFGFLQTQNHYWYCSNIVQVMKSFRCVYTAPTHTTMIYPGETKEFYLSVDLSETYVSRRTEGCNLDTIETVFFGSYYNDGRSSSSEVSMSVLIPFSEYVLREEYLY